MRVVMRELLLRLDLAPARPEAERGRVHHVTFAPSRDGEVVASERSE
jgi:hypothetical protein